jgi:hypothetical protein
MSEGGWLSLVTLIGVLILVAGGLRSYRLGSRRMLTIALIWGGIFLLVTVAITVWGIG